jgi:uncharacterized membrane protein
MTPVVKWLYLVALAVWIGSIVFWSFVAAPALFRALGPEQAGQVVRRIFPTYYLLGMVAAAVGIVTVGILLGAGAMRTPVAVLSLLLLAGMGGLNLWMRQGVAPHMAVVRERVARARAADRVVDPELEAEWKGLHRLSVQVNGAVLLGALVLLFLLVYSRIV